MDTSPIMRSTNATNIAPQGRMMRVRMPVTSREAFKLALGFTALALALRALEKIK